jgi:CrcB protein
VGGGLLGSAARGAVGLAVPAASGDFPVATLIVNLAGSFLLGFYLARRQRAVSGRWSLRFWAIGVLGSFTTFSAFSLEVLQLIDIERFSTVVGYVLASTLGGLTVALLGDRVGAVVR